jgi:hypothetical protein
MPFHLPEPPANTPERLSVSRKNHKGNGRCGPLGSNRVAGCSPFILAKNSASSSGASVLLPVPNAATVPATPNPNWFAGPEMGN